jgi:hypothetical protein
MDRDALLMVFAGFRMAAGVDERDLSTAGLGLREEFGLGSGVVEVVVDFKMPRGLGVGFLGALEGAIERFLMGFEDR